MRCAPHVVAREVLQVLKVKADEKKIGLTLGATEPIPESVETDPSRLRQVITNLVGNAIKFTKEGSVDVRFAMTHAQDGRPLLQIDVCDSGIGMTPKQLERIFDPFSQADSSVTRKFGGTGLGLTISRRFARALGGDVMVQSVQGQGSTFTITIETGDLTGIPMMDPGVVKL